LSSNLKNDLVFLYWSDPVWVVENKTFLDSNRVPLPELTNRAYHAGREFYAVWKEYDTPWRSPHNPPTLSHKFKTLQQQVIKAGHVLWNYYEFDENGLQSFNCKYKSDFLPCNAFLLRDDMWNWKTTGLLPAPTTCLKRKVKLLYLKTMRKIRDNFFIKRRYLLF
jgi:hypothetical protein